MPAVSDEKTIYLLDASGFLYRSFFAIQGLSSRGGEATGALFGFIRSYLRLIKEFNPKYVVAIFDAARSKEGRCAIYKEYKAHRKPTPPELVSQIHDAQLFCSLCSIPLLAIEGVEADDTIGSIAKWVKEVGMKACIVSGDKDMAQLIDDSIWIMNPHKNNVIIDAAKAKELYGIPPHQMRDFLAICGDASDNVPGISGLGPKTAISLLEQYGSLEAILENAATIGGKKGKTLQEEREIALISQKLVTINTEVPFEKCIDFFRIGPFEEEPLRAFLHEKSFHSLIDQLIDPSKQKSEQDSPQTTHKDTSETKYHTIDSEEALTTLLEKLSKHSQICVDTETTDIHVMSARLVGIGLGVDLNNAYYIPFKESYRAQLAPFFANKALSFYGHNIKYDLHILENAQMAIGSVCADTIISSYVLNAHERRHSLDTLVFNLFGIKKIATEDLLGKGKAQITMDFVPIKRISEYCCEDIACTIRLKAALDAQIASRGLEKLVNEIEVPLITILKDMEQTGIFVDKKILSALSCEVNDEISHLQEAIYQMAGKPFNLNSPKQLSEVLYIDLGIQPPRGTKKGKSQPSTSADILETLAMEHPIAQKLLEYRSVEKLRSTYIDTLPGEINAKTGRVHCTFNQSGTATGRLSCQNPNLQNIPVRSKLGLRIREAFRPQKDNYSFISADYSQIELRILAHVSEDEGLLEAFANNLDVHAYTASQIFHVPIEAVTDSMRHQAKAVNFGIVYGQQAFGLAQTLHIPVSAASAFIDAYFRRYKRIKEYIENAKESARKTGRAVSLTGRERLIPDINSSNGTIRAQAERLAINTPFQATAADIIKVAMIHVDSWLKQSPYKTRMLLQIHDELIFEAPDNELEAVSSGIQERMESVFDLKIPLIVKIAIGKNWAEC